jgi:hypothetical protein
MSQIINAEKKSVFTTSNCISPAFTSSWKNIKLKLGSPAGICHTIFPPNEA